MSGVGNVLVWARDEIHKDDDIIRSLTLGLQAIYMTGWAPHERQQQPMERGSATVSFQDIENLQKQLGDKKPESKQEE